MIAAIILAAGESRRMGEPKMLMKWGRGTVLGHVISVFAAAGLEDILVITGSDRENIEALVAERAQQFPVRCAFNRHYKEGGMLSSIQCGLQDLANREIAAAMIGLGDQPQVREGTVKLIRDVYEQTSHPLILPSHQMRRGHPWLVRKDLWGEIMDLEPPQTPRVFLERHAAEIHHVEAGNSSIFADLDTPEDYLKARPEPDPRHPI